MTTPNAILIAVACALGLMLNSEPAAEQSSSEPQAVAVSKPVAVESAPEWEKNIHRVYGVGYGTAVSVAADTLYTAQHVAGTYGRIHVAIDGKWHYATVHPIGNGIDGAMLKLDGGKLPAMDVREPEYRESVVVFGKRTKRQMRGLVVGANTVSLERDEGGVDFGDSGGAVIGEDGALVGIATAFEGAGEAGNRRVVHFVPAEIFPKNVVAAKPVQAQPQNCPNGRCQKPQPQFYFQVR